MTIRRFPISVTVDENGDAEVFSPPISGRLVSVRYVKPGENGYENGVDFALSVEATGQAIWVEDDVNASATRHPRAPTHSTAGVASIYAADAPVNDKIVLSQDRVKIVISDGTGDAGGETGTFHITVDG